MANHLVIGLGGTGGKILREFRKRIYEEFRGNEPGGGLNIDYIYLDSSPADLDERESWKVMGHSIHLADSQKVSTNGVNSDLLTNTQKYEGVSAFMKPWEIEMLQRDNNMVQLINSGIGGQRRRLGRLLIANDLSNKNKAQNFEAALKSAVTRLQQMDGNEMDVTFHICAGLAGGTGSGSIVDVVSQIRTQYPSTQESGEREPTFKIRLFVYMPERNLASPDHDSGYYQANGYAALMELNALSVGTYHPIDVTGAKDVITGKVRRLLNNQVPFEACYIYSNVNEAGKTLNVSKDLPVVVANFMFQTVVVPQIVGSKGKLARLVGCENKGVGAEKDKSGRNAHGRQFLSFGITRVSYPENEVREFVTYSYAQQAALQLTYNYWVEGQGYSERTEDEVGSGYNEEIKKQENRGKFLLDQHHLILSEYIIKNDSSNLWKKLDETWNAHSDAVAKIVQREIQDKKLWVREYSARMRDVFDNKFRSQGVTKFYSGQQKELRAYAAYIRRHIETLFFKEWDSGQKSMLEIEKYVKILIQDCNERITEYTTQRTKLANEKLQEHQRKVAGLRSEYDNIGWLKDAITNASGKIFNSYQSALKEYFYTATLVEAFDFAKMLLQEIIVNLASMQEGIRIFRTRLAQITKNVSDMAASKCKTNEDKDDSNIKKYNPEKVRTIVRQYTTNKEYQSSAALDIRNALVASLGEDGERSFANLYHRVDYNSMEDTMLNICTNKAIEAMEETAKKDVMSRMVGVNILEKLKQELISEAQREQFVKDLVQHAKTYVQFNNAEASEGETMMKMIQVSIPKGDENTQDFRNELIKAFRQYTTGYNFVESECVSEYYKPNEIVVVTACSGFPLRYLANMTTLKEKYDTLLIGPMGTFNRMLLHTESFDDFDKAFPALFFKKPEEIMKEMLPSLMLAYCLNLIQEQNDPTTGERFVCISGKDMLGRDAFIPIKGAKDFGQAWRTVGQDYGTAMKLKEQVEDAMKVEARSNDQKAALKLKLFDVLDNQVLNSLCEGNKFHPDYERYTQVVSDILNNELKEL